MSYQTRQAVTLNEWAFQNNQLHRHKSLRFLYYALTFIHFATLICFNILKMWRLGCFVAVSMFPTIIAVVIPLRSEQACPPEKPKKLLSENIENLQWMLASDITLHFVAISGWLNFWWGEYWLRQRLVSQWMCGPSKSINMTRDMGDMCRLTGLTTSDPWPSVEVPSGHATTVRHHASCSTILMAIWFHHFNHSPVTIIHW